MTRLDEILDVANLERHIAEGNVSVQVGAGDDAGNPKNQGAES